jgi:hypothetical protein
MPHASNIIRGEIMRKLFAIAVIAIPLNLLPLTGNAKGCLKGAAVGGVAGHVAGHHAVAGAAAGCVIQHHREKVKDKANAKAAAAAQSAQPAAPAQPVTPAAAAPAPHQ